MNSDIAYHNGQFVPVEKLVVRPQDMGFVLGITVSEQLRTFRGRLAFAQEHFERLQKSLDLVGIDTVKIADIQHAAERVSTHNHALLQAGNDLGLTIFVTPGLYPTYTPNGQSTPTVGVHSYPLPFSLWAEKYETGQVCELVSVPQVSEKCWPRELKCRSRMHYYLADREARSKQPNARAILLDENGEVNEASTANVIAYFESEGLVSPPLEAILPGVTLRQTERIAKSAGIDFSYRTISGEELLLADEVLLTSTPFCLLRASQIGSRKISNHGCFNQLSKAWSAEAGFDIVEQAQTFSDS